MATYARRPKGVAFLSYLAEIASLHVKENPYFELYLPLVDSCVQSFFPPTISYKPITPKIKILG